MSSSTVEDYLKCIFLEGRKGGDPLVSTGQLAAALKVTPGTATAMMKTLADSGLVSYEPYSGVRLTSEGTRQAAHVLRRHRVVELFLVEVLGINWSEVHEDAERLEHAVSERVLDRMDELLGRPTVDPHGDPIPSSRGVLREKEYPSLIQCPVRAPLRIARVLDQEASFLQFLERSGAVPGSKVEVISREAAADSVVVRPEGGKPFSLGFRAASKVLVESSRDG